MAIFLLAALKNGAFLIRTRRHCLTGAPKKQNRASYRALAQRHGARKQKNEKPEIGRPALPLSEAALALLEAAQLRAELESLSPALGSHGDARLDADAGDAQARRAPVTRIGPLFAGRRRECERALLESDNGGQVAIAFGRPASPSRWLAALERARRASAANQEKIEKILLAKFARPPHTRPLFSFLWASPMFQLIVCAGALAEH